MFLLVLVVAVAIAWWTDHSRLVKKYANDIRRPEPITRLGEFYVGMPWDEARKYLPMNPEYLPFERFHENGPKRGEPVGYVKTKHWEEGGQRNILLMLDSTKSIIRIDYSRIQDD
jgi:hypothetical protein